MSAQIYMARPARSRSVRRQRANEKVKVCVYVVPTGGSRAWIGIAGIRSAKSKAATLFANVNVSVISGLTSIFPLPMSASARG